MVKKEIKLMNREESNIDIVDFLIAKYDKI